MPDGYIVTNAHVVQGAYKVQVQLPAPRRGGARSIVGPRPRIVGAQIVAIDEETDLSVLKVDETGVAVSRAGRLRRRAVRDSWCSRSAARSVSTAR